MAGQELAGKEFSMSIFEKRRKKLMEIMEQKGICAAVFTPSTDYRYLTGSARQPAQRITALILTQDHQRLLLPGFEAGNEKALAEELELVPYSDLEDAAQLTAGLLPTKGCAAAGREMGAGFLLALLKLTGGLHWCDADTLMTPVRRRKDPEEIRIIEEAQHMAEQALWKLIQEPLAGRTERETASKLMELRLAEGFDAVGAGIVASGPNTALPHHINGDRIITRGDILMFDIGGTYKGYHADLTRTFAVGAVPDGFSEIYSIVLKAHMAGKEAAQAGIPAAQADQKAREVIENAGYGPFFTHRLGHGIGLDVHEEPFITSTSQLPLETGNVFSCEPGIYLPGRFGVRIEDLLVMEETGARSLNRLSKELLVI